MPDLATQIVIALCVLLTVWYVVGWRLNRTRGEHLLEWIVRGLRTNGDQITVSRLGMSGYQVNVSKAQAPFKTIEATIVLQPREILLLWILNVLRGRADYLVLKGTLRASPRGAVEVVNKKAPLAKRVLKGTGESGWTRGDTPSGLIMAFRGKGGQQQANAISHLVEDLSPRLVRLSLSTKAPHLFANASLAGLDQKSALLLLTSLRDLAQAAAPGRR
jgi:hypothetical protein